jgi:hypothetical protein
MSSVTSWLPGPWIAPQSEGASEERPRVGFVYLGEPHHLFHTAPVACALREERPDLEVVFLLLDPRHASLLRDVEAAYGIEPLPVEYLHEPRWARWWRATTVRRRPLKAAALRASRSRFDKFAAIVAAERTSTRIKALSSAPPRLIHIPHGAGDRAAGFDERIRHFDFVITAGVKDARRMLAEQLTRPGSYAISGYVKRDLIHRMDRALPALFPNSRPVVLYNAHFAARVSSWSSWAREVVRSFAAQERFNLVVAPHIKLFADRPRSVRRVWERRAVPGKILIDLDSERSIDMTYTRAADLYLGDASSQAYEFAMRPRPCVFLNDRRVRWHGDPSYRHWRMGEVVDRLEDLMPAVNRASDQFPRYRATQEVSVLEALGPFDGRAAARAARAIAEYLDAPRPGLSTLGADR